MVKESDFTCVENTELSMDGRTITRSYSITIGKTKYISKEVKVANPSTRAPLCKIYGLMDIAAQEKQRSKALHTLRAIAYKSEQETKQKNITDATTT